MTMKNEFVANPDHYRLHVNGALQFWHQIQMFYMGQLFWEFYTNAQIIATGNPLIFRRTGGMMHMPPQLTSC